MIELLHRALPHYVGAAYESISDHTDEEEPGQHVSEFLVAEIDRDVPVVYRTEVQIEVHTPKEHEEYDHPFDVPDLSRHAVRGVQESSGGNGGECHAQGRQQIYAHESEEYGHYRAQADVDYGELLRGILHAGGEIPAPGTCHLILKYVPAPESHHRHQEEEDYDDGYSSDPLGHRPP
ncbi:hypothetical protein SDC9_127782 [bioreactor metagenome]|uniref:Uncharacterized protein n=1 Tax=bioreactor metagenome TaxID=1076179 RepID=A0A645CVK8_9ZZZZ